ncbi:MAG: hypothetical protein ACRDKI_05440 [Solirubrobacterales bacterium]
MSAAKKNGHGNGDGGSYEDEFDELIRDRDDEFEVNIGAGDHPRGDYDPYADFTAGGSYGDPRSGDRGLIEAITRIIEALAGAAGDTLPPEARKQLERVLRDLLVALRDALTWMIERIDERAEDEYEIEQIPVD